jgi:hypothetical protein
LLGSWHPQSHRNGLAENAATPHEMMSITGHRSIEEVERYTKAARMRMTANAAMAKLSPPREAPHDLSHRLNVRDNSRRKAKGKQGPNWRLALPREAAVTA